MLKRIVDDPMTYVIGVTAFLIFLGVMVKAGVGLSKFIHSMYEMKEWIDTEMHSDDRRSLKDFAKKNDKDMESFKRSMHRIELRMTALDKRMTEIEGKLPDGET